MKNIEIFKNNNGDCCGFAGKVFLYDEEIFIDTRSGKGYDKVLEKLAPLIHRLMGRFRFNNKLNEDMKQDIIVHILEGIPKYDPTKDTKLSTFIEMRVNRRLINELRDKSRIYRNATFLNISSFSITCKCGHNFNAIIATEEENSYLCPKCNAAISTAKKKVSVNLPEMNEVSVNSNNSNSDVYSENCNNLFKNQANTDDQAILNYDMKKWLKKEDPRISKMVELIYFEDYSIKDAAKQAGLSGTFANLKLKDLKNKKRVRNLFGR